MDWTSAYDPCLPGCPPGWGGLNYYLTISGGTLFGPLNFQCGANFATLGCDSTGLFGIGANCTEMLRFDPVNGIQTLVPLSASLNTKPLPADAATVVIDTDRLRAYGFVGNGMGTLLQGSTESSNVNVVEELVNMIETQQAYEMNSRAVETTDQMLTYATQNM